MAPLPLLVAAFLYVAFGTIASTVPALHSGATTFLLGVVIAFITASSTASGDMLVSSVSLWLTSSTGIVSMLLIPPLIHTRLMALASFSPVPLSVSSSVISRACTAIICTAPAFAYYQHAFSLVIRRGELCRLVRCACSHAAVIQQRLVLAAEHFSGCGPQRRKQVSASPLNPTATVTKYHLQHSLTFFLVSVSWFSPSPVFDLPSSRPASLSILRTLRFDSLVAPLLAAALFNAGLQADGIGNLASAISGNIAGNFCWNLFIGAFIGCAFALFLLLLLFFTRTSFIELTVSVTAL